MASQVVVMCRSPRSGDEPFRTTRSLGSRVTRPRHMRDPISFALFFLPPSFSSCDDEQMIKTEASSDDVLRQLNFHNHR